jgi:hypothetical protein
VLVMRDANTPEGVRTVLLVSSFKQGATERARQYHDKTVQARGFTINRQGRYILELLDTDDAIEVTTTPAIPISATPYDQGEVELVGEIIDPKCYLGAMKPGEGKVHRACAVRCIDSGIAPMFLTRTTDGKATFFLLADATGRACHQAVLDHVAEPITIRGRVEKRGDMLYLYYTNILTPSR